MRLGASEAAFGILLYKSELLRLAPTPSLPFPLPTTSTMNASTMIDCSTTWSLRPLFLYFVIFFVLVGIPCLLIARLHQSVFVLLRKIERLLESVSDRLTQLLTSNLRSQCEREQPPECWQRLLVSRWRYATIRQNFDDLDSQIAKLKELLGASEARHLETEKVYSDMKNEFDTWKQKNEEVEKGWMVTKEEVKRLGRTVEMADKGQQQQAEESAASSKD